MVLFSVEFGIQRRGMDGWDGMDSGKQGNCIYRGLKREDEMIRLSATHCLTRRDVVSVCVFVSQTSSHSCKRLVVRLEAVNKSIPFLLMIPGLTTNALPNASPFKYRSHSSVFTQARARTISYPIADSPPQVFVSLNSKQKQLSIPP